jgi:O-antigen chain-terminating methyltransferase
MSETPTVEQVMERIRAQVRQQEGSGTSPRAAANVQKGPRHSDTPVPSPPAALSSREDISRLHAEVCAALDGHLQTGQLNARRPGLHNDVLQFIKKVIRRSLTWYTRPLHRFQASVIRALEHVTNVLQNQDKALLNQSSVLRQMAEQVQTQSDALRKTSEQVQNQSDSLRKTSEQVQTQSDALRSTSEQVQTQSEALRQAAERALNQWVEKIHSELTRVDEKQRELERKLRDELHFEAEKSYGNFTQQASRVDVLHAQLAFVQEQLRQTAAVTRGKERDLRRIRYASETRNFASPQAAGASATPTPTPPMFPSEIRRESEFDYFLFEDHYRGNEADIRGRQSAYLKLFGGRENVIDIGCGRGEFLELLRDNNITARGVEIGTDQYLLCREKGLDVIQQDLFTFLESQPDGSLGGLFSAQVMEHMTASDQLRFVSLAYQKCSSQSPVAFETINPECVYALVHNFFLDPTHVRPVHPGTLEFAMESQGFRNVQLLFSNPVSNRNIPHLTLNGDTESLQRFNAAMEHVNELLYGHQDYAAIGWK